MQLMNSGLMTAHDFFIKHKAMDTRVARGGADVKVDREKMPSFLQGRQLSVESHQDVISTLVKDTSSAMVARARKGSASVASYRERKDAMRSVYRYWDAEARAGAFINP